MATAHPLAEKLQSAAEGRFPADDGVVELLPPDSDGTAAVVALTGHAYVLAHIDQSDLTARAFRGGFGATLKPAFLLWLAGESHAIGNVDVLLARPGAGGGLACATREHDDHPRVRRAYAHRREVAVYADNHGLVIIGSGLAGRRELSVELFAPGAAPPGAGRALIAAGLAQVPRGEWVWAQVAPGNARSLRALLAAGFAPIGSEALLMPHP